MVTDTMRRVVMVTCAALLLLPVYIKSRTIQDIPERAAFCQTSSSRIFVKVAGDVRHSGIYEVPANSLAVSAIIMAVPMQPLVRYNVAISAGRPLQNGSAVSLVKLPDGSQQVLVNSMSVAERLVLRIPLEIGTLNEADFDRLPGVGPALAKRIVEYRQNNGGILRVEDLLAIEGIGEKKYQQLHGYFQQSVITK